MGRVEQSTCCSPRPSSQRFFAYWHQARLPNGFNPHQPLKSAARNMQSALVNPKHVTEYLQNGLKEQRVAGPLTESLAKGVHVSRFGLIPKRHQQGKWRLILDLSHPPGYSIMVLQKNLPPCNMHQSTMLLVSSLTWVQVPSWPRLILHMRIETYLCIRLTGICLAWSGRGRLI